MSTDKVSSELLIQLLLAESHLTNDVDEWVEKSQFIKLITSTQAETIPELSEISKRMKEVRKASVDLQLKHRCFAIAYCLSQPMSRYDDRKSIAKEIAEMLSIAGDEYSVDHILTKWLSGVNPIAPPDVNGISDLIRWKKLAPPLKGEWRVYPPSGESLHQDDVRIIEGLIKELAEQTSHDLTNRIEYWHGKRLTNDGRQKKLSIRIK